MADKTDFGAFGGIFKRFSDMLDGTHAEVVDIPITRKQAANTIQVSIGASATPSAALPVGTRSVRLLATVDCWVKIGVTATAAANTSIPVKADIIEYFSALEGERVSVIQRSAGGTLDVTPMN